MVALSLVILAAAAPVGGQIRTSEATVVVAAEPPPPGQTVHLPEGWYRVDSAPDDDGDDASGSLTVVDARTFALAAPAPAAPLAAPAPAPVREVDPFERSCRQLRSAYVKELFRMAGIEEVDRPLDFLENLQGPALAGGPLSPWVRLNLFGLPAGGPWEPSVAGVLVLQNLGGNFELQRLAHELESCREEPADQVASP